MATLTTKVTESITINGIEQGASNTLAIANIDDVFKRIVTIDQNDTTEIASFGDSNHAAACNLQKDKVKYIRITNLEASNTCFIALISGDFDTTIQLQAGQSFILCSPVDAFLPSDSTTLTDLSTTITDFKDVLSILAETAGSGGAKLEIFVASNMS